MRLRRILSCLAAAVTAVAVPTAFLSAAHAAPSQATVVNAVPATSTPDFNDGIVYAIGQVGSQIIVGGSFTNESNHGSTTVINQKYLVAFNAATGALNTAFAPVLDGEVHGVTPGPTANTVYVTGAFNNVNGGANKSVILLNTTTGATVTGFKAPSINGQGQAVALVNNHLILGGTFYTVGGKPHSGLVSLNPTTGAVDTYLNVQLTGHHSYNGSGANGAVGANRMAVNPAGTRLVVIGNFKNADGVVHDQVVMIDLNTTSAVVDPNWNTSGYSAACYSNAFDSYIRGVDFSPDGAYFVIVATGGNGTNIDGTPSLCDTAARWTMSDTGTNVQPTWVDYTGNDTLLSVQITGTAVYVGGHQRWLNNPNAYDSPGAGSVPRPGLAALDPANGLPLAWNPGRNPRGAGAWALFATANGLYVGSDTDYIGNFKYRHKKLAYFPLAGGASPASTATRSLPANVYLAGALPNATNTNVLYRVNAGGTTLAATDIGPDWVADDSDAAAAAAYRNSGSNAAGWGPVANVSATVPSSTPRAIFDSERWSPSDNPRMSWDFPVASGTAVQVRLYFANRYPGTGLAGQRVFDVDLDGTRVLDHYDIVGDVGDQTGTMKAYDITSDGHVNIDFSHETENPLINGIEIVKTGGSQNPPGNGVDDLAYRAYSGSTIGALTTVPNTGIAWSSTRGAFMTGSTIFYGSTNGNFYRASFDGTTVGTSVVVDPYNDPAWSGVATGSGQTYRGVVSGYYGEIPNVTGAFYSNGRLYYSLLGQTTLFWRYFTPDSGIIGGTRFTVAGGDFSSTAGEFLSGSTLYYANRTNGTLHTVAFSNGGTDGANPSVNAATDTVVSGPAVDGNDWRARSLFAYGNASTPNRPPVASATASCTNLTCSFDGSGSSDPDGSVASYAWNFGDNTTGTGRNPTHTYGAAGTYNYTLTVTDDRGMASPVFSGSVVVTAPSTPPIGFAASAHSYATATTAAKVTTPSAVAAGDTELLFVSVGNSTATSSVIGPPSGWTQIGAKNPYPLQTAVFQRTATASDAGSVVTVPLSASSAAAIQLVDYTGVGSSAIGVTDASDTSTASHTAPPGPVATSGSWVVSFWADRSSTTTAWNLPGGVTQRDVTIGTGGGRVTGVVGDSNSPVATGTYPAQTATVNAASGKGAMFTLVLPPRG